MSRQTYPDPATDPNLVARYLFNEGAGSVVADVSGNGFDGTASNMGWAAGFLPHAAGDFVRANSPEVSVPYNFFSSGSAFSMSCWVKRKDVTLDNELVYSGRFGGLDDIRWSVGVTSGQPHTGIVLDDGSAFGASSPGLPWWENNMWVHIGWTHVNGGTIKLCVNGQVVATGSGTHNYAGQDAFGFIGKRSVGTGFDHLNGQIQDFRIYNRALTDLEMKGIYKGGLNAAKQDFTTNLVGRWNFDEGTGTTVGDSSGNNEDGTATDLTWVDGERLGPHAGGFNGSTSVVSVPDTDNLGCTNQMTVMGWVKRTALGNIDTIISKYNSNVGNQSFVFQIDSTTNKLCYKAYSSPGNAYNRQSTSADTIPAGEWVHVAATIDSGPTTVIYINGVAVAQEDIGSAGTFTTFGVNSQAIRLGTMTDGGGDSTSYQFDGQMDDVRVYNAALTEAQIRQVMRATQPPFGVINQIRGGGQ